MIIQKASIKDLNDIQKLNLMLFQKEHKEFDPSLNLDWTMGKEGKKYYSNMIKD